MLLVWFLKFLNLDKVTQRAFAEYLSKRNLVERVHAIENRVLSSHGPFCSAFCNKELIQCFWGIGAEDNFVFNDESCLKSFGLLSDERRREDDTTYKPVKNDILEYLENVWCVEKNFKGCYSEDYRTLTSLQTACIDKYSVSIYQENDDWRSKEPLERFDRQPLPDYQRWIESGELHYLSYEARRDFPRGPWDECSGLFLPEKVLDSAFRVLPSPLEEELRAIAYLAWISVEQASQFYASAQKQLSQQREEDLKQEAWNIERAGGMNPNLKKYELVQQIVESSGDAEKYVAMLSEKDLHDGSISSIPNGKTGLMKLSLAHLRAILRAHDVLEVGSNEELIVRVGLLKAGHQDAAFSRERLAILHQIATARELVRNQASSTRIICKRKFAHGKTEMLTAQNSCLQDLLQHSAPTIDATSSNRDPEVISAGLEIKLLEIEEKSRSNVDKERPAKSTNKDKTEAKDSKRIQSKINEKVRRSGRKRKEPAKVKDGSESPNFFTHVGTLVDVLWTEKDLEGTNWEPGWYRGEVQ
ncbi:unnamed protein product [Pocillopora meandrina]|uniref:Uncharacterized protein n=1 Tax=Pocillopora meandrina TaxID=46732 RepID=A0AAU9VN17_9CNID|nr:unnamed protein product [Pocillopora meandrina]